MPSPYTDYVNANLENIKRNIKRLVDIRSVQSAPRAGAPYGEGVRKAQLEAMKLCGELGFKTTDCGGRIAYAHYGPEDRYIGVIAHIDVVPEGGGWDADPFDCRERDGYLVGRGVLDDKGPFVIAAYAAKYLIDSAEPLRYGVRLIMGLDEETGMHDVEYYKANYPQPVFAFTPDAGFPVGHGEKGVFSADLVSAPIRDGAILSLSGGVASNVVADGACAVLRAECLSALRKAAEGREDIAVSAAEGGARVEARGRAAHAGTPQGGINAIRLLADFLLESGALTGAERDAMAFVSLAASSYEGGQFGIACDDGVFTPLTIICGMIKLEDSRVSLNVNSRYPTCITGKDLENRIAARCAERGFNIDNVEDSAPFYMDPGNPAVQLMCDIYNEVTGQSEKPFVMSGGTYARHMANAVSYGIEFPGQEKEDPEWVGACHMKNEGLKISRIALACEIYIKSLTKLQLVDF